jgi:hypothetical protein
MCKQTNEFVEAIRILAEDKRRGLVAHPLPERLAEYRAGHLDEYEAEDIREHIALCPECTQTLLEMAGADEAGLNAEAHISEEDLKADIESLSARLAEPEIPSEQPAARWKNLEPERRLTIAWALAATFLACSVGLSMLVWSLKQDNDRAIEPRVNVNIIDLVPIGEWVDRSTRGPEAPAFPKSAPSVILILNLTDQSQLPAYEVEIASADPSRVEQRIIRGLERSEEGNFTLEIIRDMLPPGNYRLTLVGVDGKLRKTLAEYKTEIEYR